jgi:hypothetical protein
VNFRALAFIVTTILLIFTKGTFAGPYDSCSKSQNVNGLPAVNKLVMDAVKQMPSSMKYESGDERIDALGSAIKNVNGHLVVNPSDAGNAFCSGATYLVLMKALSQAQANNQVHLSTEAINALLVHSKAEQPDGYGAWGRWNADGPGSAMMVKDLGVGANFTQLDNALPGDFMRLFWNDKIGENGKQSENAHSVVFDSFRECANGPNVCFWSANSKNDVSTPGDRADKKGGWALKCAPRQKIVRTVLSRVTDLNAFNNAATAMDKNSPYYVNQRLNEIGSRSLMSVQEMESMIKTNNSPVARITDTNQ